MNDDDSAEVAADRDWEITVDPDRCILSGICLANAPEHFQKAGNVSEPTDARRAR